MWTQTNIEGVYMKGNEYRLDPHVEVEVSEGVLECTTYEPKPIHHKYDIVNDVIVRNDTRSKQYITSTGMIGPRSKSDLTILSIRSGRRSMRERKDR